MPKVGILFITTEEIRANSWYAILDIFLGRVHVPVSDDLESNDGVDEAAADVSQNEDLVPGLLDTGEDPGDGAETEQEAGDGGELTGVTVLEVGDDLDEFPC